jgi:hypothetical protein
MNASLTDSDLDTPSTHVAADQRRIPRQYRRRSVHVAYADIRPTRSSIELSVDVATGNPRFHQ